MLQLERENPQMRPEDVVAQYCKLCGRELEGAEKLTAICVRCKAVGNRQGAIDVQDAAIRALSEYLAPRADLLGNGYGVAAFVIAVVIIAASTLAVLVAGTSSILTWTATLLSPVALIGAVLGAVGLAHQGTNRTLSVIGLAVGLVTLALFAVHLSGTLPGVSLTSDSRWQQLMTLIRELVK